MPSILIEQSLRGEIGHQKAEIAKPNPTERDGDMPDKTIKACGRGKKVCLCNG